MNKRIEIVKKIAIVSNFFIGVGALFGGAVALIPGATESMGMTTDVLRNAPFKTFLIPGLFLLVVLAGGNIFSGISFLRKSYNSSFYVFLLGLIMILWIVIQGIMLWNVMILHVIFFSLGFLQAYCGLYLIKKQHLVLPFSAKQN